MRHAYTFAKGVSSRLTRLANFSKNILQDQQTDFRSA